MVQEVDLLAAGVRRDDLYIDHGVASARASHPNFDLALSHSNPVTLLQSRRSIGRAGQRRTCLPWPTSVR